MGKTQTKGDSRIDDMIKLLQNVNNNNNNVYLIKSPHYQEPFKDAVQIICNIT